MGSILNAQPIQILDSSGSVINNDTLTFTHFLNNDISQSDFTHEQFIFIFNSSLVDSMNIDMTRHEIQFIPGSGDYFCWGTQCKLEQAAGSIPVWQAFDPVKTAPQDTAGGLAPLAIYISPNEKFGEAIFRYEFVDQIDTSNKASVFVKWVIVNITSLEENSFNNKVAIYPNPAIEKTSINFESALNYKQQKIEVYNITGKLVKEMTVNHGATNIEMNTEDLTSGIYFVNLIANGTRVASKKLIVK